MTINRLQTTQITREPFKFHHPITQDILGDLRKGRLNRIFNNQIPLDNQLT